MPTHVFHARHQPPSRLDRVRVHSSDVGLALLSVIAAGQVLLSPLLPGYEPSRNLTDVPAGLALALAVFVGAGGVLALRGLMWSGPIISTGWTLERAGWWLASGGWGGYAVAVAWAYPGSTLSWTIPAALAALSAARAVVVWLIEKDTRPAAERLRRVRVGEEDEEGA